MEIVLDKRIMIINNDHRYAVGFSHTPESTISIVVTDKDGVVCDRCPVFEKGRHAMGVAKDGTLGLIMLESEEFICPIYTDKRKCGGCVGYEDCKLAQ